MANRIWKCGNGHEVSEQQMLDHVVKGTYPGYAQGAAGLPAIVECPYDYCWSQTILQTHNKPDPHIEPQISDKHTF